MFVCKYKKIYLKEGTTICSFQTQLNNSKNAK
uniref:Uncharacterized protein n=1 Tax=Anguilla anguilla TaxID=7936 RepID=A0A0E9QKI6_ANGAN